MSASFLKCQKYQQSVPGIHGNTLLRFSIDYAPPRIVATHLCGSPKKTMVRWRSSLV